MHRRGARLALFLVLVAAGGVAGCEEEFSDERRGVLDLNSFYTRMAVGVSGTRLDPDDVPEQILAETGYIAGQVAELYNFGQVPVIRDPATGEPVGVRVQPMYFFYDQNDRPLFSRPVRELRDGTDWIKGGKAVLNPNPRNHCVGAPADEASQQACKARNEEEKKKPYPQRTRELLVDAARGSADYQRPIVDLTPEDNRPPRAQYTGFWEIVEVKVPAKYEPDAIKSLSTLQKALESGKFKARHTGKVINCPIVDERTHVSRGITGRRIFHPRIELWYRGLVGTCFLANGWETLGNDSGDVLFAGIDRDRVETFDVARISLGTGSSAVNDLVVPVGRSYVPALVSDPQSGDAPAITRVANNIVGTSVPRRSGADPGGYRPAQWLFDVPAPAEYEGGKWKGVEDFDRSTAEPRRTMSGAPYVANIAVRGLAVKCSFVPNYDTLDFRGRPRMQCGKRPPNMPNAEFDPTGDPVCNAERDPFNPADPPLECNKDTCFCDAPVVGYGQACGPGLAQCSRQKDKLSEEGYECFPPWGGFCHRSCGGANAFADMNAGVMDLTKQLDSRCLPPPASDPSATATNVTGDPVPGLLCFGGLGCIKMCDQNVSDPKQCSAEVTLSGMKRDIQEGQTCQDFGLHVCAWPDSHTPADFTIPK